MSLKRQLVGLVPSFVKLLLAPLGCARREQVLAKVSPELIPVVPVEFPDGKDLQFYCPGELPLWRVRTFFDKEPETLRWIDGFEAGDVLWDIGANVGLYSLYAAMRGASVWAFEPSASNYLCLSKNIALNTLPVNALCMAFSEASSLGHLHLSSVEYGAALHQFETLGGATSSAIVQGMISFSMDDFAKHFSVAVPNHIKIDVDGLEFGIIRGARGVLANATLKSLLVELDDSEVEQYAEAMDIIQNSGFSLVEKTRAPMNDDGEDYSVYNHIFVRR